MQSMTDHRNYCRNSEGLAGPMCWTMPHTINRHTAQSLDSDVGCQPVTARSTKCWLWSYEQSFNRFIGLKTIFSIMPATVAASCGESRSNHQRMIVSVAAMPWMTFKSCGSQSGMATPVLIVNFISPHQETGLVPWRPRANIGICCRVAANVR